MEANLRDIAAGRGAESFAVTYSDMHGLWGGVTMTLTHTGDYEQTLCQPGGAPAIVRRRVTSERIAALARLLVEIRAWEQHIPERAPVPDESRATLTVRCGAAESSIWEWYNDLSKNQRLIQVRDLLLQLGEAIPGGGVPN
jgi:hypothetical protein